MKKLILGLIAMGALASMVCAGTESYSGKEMKQVAPAPPPCPEWYADNEFNVGVWGAYAFTGTDNNRADPELADDGNTFGTYDRFLGGDHAWGGGIDAKYFFRRYFGIGLEGFGLAAHGTQARFDHPPDNAFEEHYETDKHVVGGVLGTLTLRYPIRCTRFSPYVWAGGGGIFGGHNDRLFVNDVGQSQADLREESKGMAQFGGGLEIRITPHIGWMGDFSWNVVDGPQNNFGMARTGVNFAF